MFFQSGKSLQWQETSPTTFQRNIDPCEAFHALNGTHEVPSGRRRRDITAVAKLRSGQKVSVQQARTAWISLRRKHPAMASVLKGTKRFYQKSDEKELQSWLEQTLVIIPDDENITPELLDRLEATARPTLYFLVESSTFAIRVPHHTMDTIGVLYLLNDLLREVGRPEHDKSALPFQEQADDLSCGLREATRTQRPSIAQLLRLLKIRQRWVKSYPSIGIIPDQSKCYSGVSSWKDLKFSESMTDDILRGARKFGLTLTHASHAALIVASKVHGGFRESSNYSSVIVINVRNRGTDPSMLERNVASTQHVVWPITVPATDFLSTAEQVKQRYVDTIQNKDLMPLGETVFLEGIRTMKNSERFHSAPFVSSFGKVENFLSSDHGSLRIEDISFVVESSREDILIGIWSYQGRLTIRVMYNMGYHSDESIERYLHTTEQVLSNGLGLA